MQMRQQRQRTAWGTGMKPKLDATRTCFGKSAENKKLTLFIKKETRKNNFFLCTNSSDTIEYKGSRFSLSSTMTTLVAFSFYEWVLIATW